MDKGWVRKGPGVPFATFLGVIWGCVGLACLCLGIRLYARFRGRRRLFWDDALVTFAFLLSLTTAALWQWKAPTMYDIINTFAGFRPPPDDVAQKTHLWLAVSLIAELFFYTALAMVKISLLLFFRQIGQRTMRMFVYVWWALLLLVVGVWATNVATVHYKCLVKPSLEFLLVECLAEEETQAQLVSLRLNCALDVISDFLIMLIPTSLVWGTKLPARRKVALIGLFSLTLITITIAITRVADIGSTRWFDGEKYGPLDVTHLWLWSAIEPCIAISVASLSAFPQLFAANKPVFKPSDTFLARLKRPRNENHNSNSPNNNSRRSLFVTNISQTAVDVEMDQLEHQEYDANMKATMPESETQIESGPSTLRPLGIMPDPNSREIQVSTVIEIVRSPA